MIKPLSVILFVSTILPPKNMKSKAAILFAILQDYRILREHWVSLFGLEALSTRGSLQPNRIHHYKGIGHSEAVSRNLKRFQ